MMHRRKKGVLMSNKSLKERIIKSSLFLCAAFSIVVVLFIFVFLVFMGFPAIIDVIITWS